MRMFLSVFGTIMTLWILAASSGKAEILLVSERHYNASTVYREISQALYAANAGDTVLIDKGSYEEETLILDKPVLLAGMYRDSVIVRGVNEWRGGSIIEVTSDSCEIRGIMFQYSPQNDMRGAIIKCSNASPTIDNNSFVLRDDYAWPAHIIYCFGNSSPLIYGNNFFIGTMPNRYAITLDNCPSTVQALHNYWGTVDYGRIETIVYDGQDNGQLGEVNYSPISSSQY